jgi:hypothetical protein
MLIFAGHSQLRPGLDPCTAYVMLVAEGTFLSKDFDFITSLYFHTCSIIIFVLILPIPERQAGEVWQHSKKAKLFRLSGSSGRNVTLISSFKVA